MDEKLLALMDVIISLVGSRLSLIDEQLPPTPSVIFARDRNTKPDYPYITVDSMTSLASGGNSLQRYYKEDTGDGLEGHAVDILWNSMVDIRCYGDDAYSILQELKGKLEFGSAREQLREEAGCGILETQDVRKIPQLLATEYSDDCILPIIVNYIDSYVDTSTAGLIIDTIDVGLNKPELAAELKQYLDDPDPLLVKFNVQTP